MKNLVIILTLALNAMMTITSCNNENVNPPIDVTPEPTEERDVIVGFGYELSPANTTGTPDHNIVYSGYTVTFYGDFLVGGKETHNNVDLSTDEFELTVVGDIYADVYHAGAEGARESVLTDAYFLGRSLLKTSSEGYVNIEPILGQGATFVTAESTSVENQISKITINDIDANLNTMYYIIGDEDRTTDDAMIFVKVGGQNVAQSHSVKAGDVVSYVVTVSKNGAGFELPKFGDVDPGDPLTPIDPIIPTDPFIPFSSITGAENLMVANTNGAIAGNNKGTKDVWIYGASYDDSLEGIALGDLKIDYAASTDNNEVGVLMNVYVSGTLGTNGKVKSVSHYPESDNVNVHYVNGVQLPYTKADVAHLVAEHVADFGRLNCNFIVRLDGDEAQEFSFILKSLTVEKIK